VDSFFIDYTIKAIQTIDFQMIKIRNLTQIFIGIEENWAYIRQINNPYPYHIEYIFKIKLDIIPELIKEQPASINDSLNWVFSKIVQQPNGNIKIFNTIRQIDNTQIVKEL
jgi:hypothetical protein